MASQDCVFVTTLWNGRLPKQELLLNPEILLREDYNKFDRNELIFFFFFFWWLRPARFDHGTTSLIFGGKGPEN